MVLLFLSSTISVAILYPVIACIYAAIGLYLYRCLMADKDIHKSATLIILFIGITLHSVLITPQILTLYGLNFNIFNTISLISLFFLLFYGLFSLYRPILSLGVLALPVALIGLTIGQFGRASYEPLTNLSIGLQAHILLSIAAYCVLLMAAVQAIILRLQIRELKHQTIHRFWVSKLPSLQSMESLLFDMILMGFVILSVALGLGFMATYDVLAQHIAHKLFFSTLSWMLFGILIAGHYKYGWRGKRAATFTIYGFILLAIGFVGSKMVLELIIT